MPTVEVTTGPPLDLARPPTSIYLQGYRYSLVGPRFVKPPLALTVKLINNWVGPVSRVAKNIWYALMPTGTDTTSTSVLQGVADAAMNAFASMIGSGSISNQWVLRSVTAKDNSGSSPNQANSTHAQIAGGGAVPPLPPQCAVAVSWVIPTSYRGGKPRWYIPGIIQNASTVEGDSFVTPSFALSFAVAANTFLSTFNTTATGGAIPTAGTISYQLHHTPLTTPAFRPFITAHVHTRLDSQRRRSGKESAGAVEP